MKPFTILRSVVIAVILCLSYPLTSRAFSVYAHLAIIDASWKKSILPLLKEKYPDATEAELKVAHSYAYGGSLMPDMGYFPFGSVYFTNLVHYVRTGDFMDNLLSQAKNINEYAFAIGAVSHYFTDEYGHSMATNVAEPIVYPNVARKFGNLVTYEEYPIYHSRMEFGFDVLQTARGNYASQAYHDFIGFNVAKSVLQRAFLLTYGQNLDSVLNGNLDRNISTFRWAVRSLLPGLTRTAWSMKKSEILKNNPGMSSRKFHFKIKRREYYHDYGRDRDKPNFRTRITAFIISILPKIGPLKALKFEPPGPEAEKLFIKAFDTTLVKYSLALKKMESKGKPNLPDMDFDTGKPTVFGEYGLADETYSLLVIALGKNRFTNVTLPLKKSVLSFYSKADSTADKPKTLLDWKKTNYALQELKNKQAIPMDSLRFPTDTTGKVQAKTGR